MSVLSMSSGSSSGMMPRKLFDYEILDVLGKGAHSVIYAAAHPESKQLCALKHVIIKFEKEMRFFEQLQNELSVGQFVNHRTVRQSLEIKTKHDRASGQMSEAALVMEFFDGLALDKWTASLDLLTGIFLATAQALEKMHTAGLVHCDIKPANILANEACEIRVIDLGQTCRIGTVKKRLQGTPDYISPEQARLDPLTPRTDIYNLGATMYRALTGKNLPTILTREGRLHEPPPPTPPHAVNPEVSEPLSKLVLECVRSDPQQRPPNMGAVIHSLEALNPHT